MTLVAKLPEAGSAGSSAETLLANVRDETSKMENPGGVKISENHLVVPMGFEDGASPTSSNGGSPSCSSAGGSPPSSTTGDKHLSVTNILLRILGVLGLLYCFICSLDLLSNAFRLIGGETAGKVFKDNKAVNNPIAGLMMGVLVTVLVQSSSTSSSIVVAMVASRILSVPPAVPVIMGANIGTSVTNTIVALGQIQDGDMFERSFAAATVHDMFNVLTVLCLLPVEAATGFLVIISEKMVDCLNLPKSNAGDVKFLSVLTDPITDHIVEVDKGVIKSISLGKPLLPGQTLLKRYCDKIAPNSTVIETERQICPSIFSYMGLSDAVSGVVLLVFSLAVLFFCLIFLVKILRSIFQGHISKVINKTVNADFPGCCSYFTGYVAILIGVIMTILVQSSSIFTSTLTPLVGLQIITLERAFPLTLGSNIGTTVTSILAALAANGENFRFALQISFCHLLFNVIGICIWYPVSYMRKIPLSCARQLGRTTKKYRWFSFAYIILMFFVIPAFIFGLSYLGSIYVIIFASIVGTIAAFVLILRALQKRKVTRDFLPSKLQTFKFLPKCLRSLEPYDRHMTKLYRKLRPAKPNLSRRRRITESSIGLTEESPCERKPQSKLSVKDSKRKQTKSTGKGKFNENIIRAGGIHDIEKGQEAGEDYDGNDVIPVNCAKIGYAPLPEVKDEADKKLVKNESSL